ncbi:MAG: hypothetical protein U1F76_18510 [Candidatus Competibacteraceae bacterium]
MTQILTQLYRDATELELAIGPRLTGGDWDAVVLFVLNLEPGDFIPVAQMVTSDTPVFLADCYGILGYSAEEDRNIELMEAGRGQEYGGVGGDGGQGVVVVAFAGGVVATVATLPEAGTTAHMVVAAHGSNVGALLAKQASSIYYGGVAKATFRYDPAEERFESIPCFCISTLAAPEQAIGITSFTEDAKGSVRTLLQQAPAGSRMEAVALFPCYMRGKNEYGANNVEPDAVSELLPEVPIYGMFCHGELGPRQCVGFDSTQKPQQACTQHSMTTIVAIHATESG